MKNKIKLLIISNNEVDTNKIKTNYPNWFQNDFDILVLKNDDNIQHYLAEFEPDVIMTRQIDNMEYPNLSKIRFEERKIWIHPSDFYVSDFIINCFKYSLNDKRQPLFSIITPTYNTEIYQIERTYNSLVNQTFDNWEWVILNVGNSEVTKNKLLEIANSDIRVRLFEGYSKNYSIGHNKRMLGGLAIGDYIVELDHDDELTNDALELIKKGFEEFPSVGFIYSDCCEMFDDGTFVEYPNGWGWGFGAKYWQKYNNNNYLVMETPEINSKTIRYITSAPNHVRVWKKEIYDKINGHNPKMFVADDYELIVRTFLNTIMLKIPKMLYIQHYKDESTAQRERNAEIQRLTTIISGLYEDDIKNRFKEFMVDDFAIVDGVLNFNTPNPENPQNVNILMKL